MNTTVTIRFLSGREEKFEFDLWGGVGVKARLDAFLKSPNLVMQADEELIIIPVSAIESMSIAVPEEQRGHEELSDIRAVKRLS